MRSLFIGHMCLCVCYYLFIYLLVIVCILGDLFVSLCVLGDLPRLVNRSYWIYCSCDCCG
jgi:hypothetical protein